MVAAEGCIIGALGPNFNKTYLRCQCHTYNCNDRVIHLFNKYNISSEDPPYFKVSVCYQGYNKLDLCENQNSCFLRIGNNLKNKFGLESNSLVLQQTDNIPLGVLALTQDTLGVA